MDPLINLEQLRFWKGSSYAAVLVLLLIWESLMPFMALFRTGKERVIHIFRNLLINFINVPVVGIAAVWVWDRAAIWSYENQFGLAFPYRRNLFFGHNSNRHYSADRRTALACPLI